LKRRRTSGQGGDQGYPEQVISSNLSQNQLMSSSTVFLSKNGGCTNSLKKYGCYTNTSIRNSVFFHRSKSPYQPSEQSCEVALYHGSTSDDVDATASTCTAAPDVDEMKVKPSVSTMEHWASKRDGFLPIMSSTAASSVQSQLYELSLSRSIVKQDGRTSPCSALALMAPVNTTLSQCVPPNSCDYDSKLGIVMSPEACGASTSGTCLNGEQRSLHYPPNMYRVRPVVRDVLIQTDAQTDIHLINLRRSVIELLKICVPEFISDSLSLTDESVDELVLRVISAQ